jgi:hypothetical protein
MYHDTPAILWYKMLPRSLKTHIDCIASHRVVRLPGKLCYNVQCSIAKLTCYHIAIRSASFIILPLSLYRQRKFWFKRWWYNRVNVKQGLHIEVMFSRPFIYLFLKWCGQYLSWSQNKTYDIKLHRFHSIFWIWYPVWKMWSNDRLMCNNNIIHVSAKWKWGREKNKSFK